MFFHPTYLIVIPGILLMLWAQNRVQGTYQRYAQIPSTLGMTGEDVARTILRRMGVHDVRVEPVRGQLTDHYDPSTRTVRLSEGIFNSRSLAAAAVAAHECGHVLQDVQGYSLMNLRSTLVPVAGFGANFGPMLVLAGLFLGSSSVLVPLGIVLFAAAILFHIVTLPVEFDASNRALRLIDELGILQGQEHEGAKAVLNAAAWTYVATAVVAVLQLLQYLILARRND